MQRVQTRSRRIPPLTIARTRWMFGSNRRGRTLWAWLTRRPTTGLLPQTSQCLAISESRKQDRDVQGGLPGPTERVSIAEDRASPGSLPGPVAGPSRPDREPEGRVRRLTTCLAERTVGGRVSPQVVEVSQPDGRFGRVGSDGLRASPLYG